MNATQPSPTHGDFAVVRVLAQVLERAEQNPARIGAAQYRAVVQHLAQELRKLESTPQLGQLLGACPAAAQVYENLVYEHAGLCRSPLDASLSAEIAARDAIFRAMRQPTKGSASS